MQHKSNTNQYKNAGIPFEKLKVGNRFELVYNFLNKYPAIGKSIGPEKDPTETYKMKSNNNPYHS
jgi:hypothetical protein